MQLKGVMIPGLSMEKHELPEVDGFLRLQNAEIGDGPVLAGNYGIIELAEMHLKTIQSLARGQDTFHIVGMSLGGMVVSALASTFRSQLPRKCRFHFVVTSANTERKRSVTEAMLQEWKTAKPGDVEGFARILSPFFSPTFLENQYELAKNYFIYRAHGRNMQSPKAFMRQVAAALNYDGSKHYSQIDGTEAEFIHGGEDLIFNAEHVAELRALCPDAEHRVIPKLGHMVNIERPEVFAGIGE